MSPKIKKKKNYLNQKGSFLLTCSKVGFSIWWTDTFFWNSEMNCAFTYQPTCCFLACSYFFLSKKNHFSRVFGKLFRCESMIYYSHSQNCNSIWFSMNVFMATYCREGSICSINSMRFFPHLKYFWHTTRAVSLTHA